jgi:shikimate kinase
MNTDAPLTIYAMVGPMGSGKTTLALEISKDRGAEFFSLDQTIKGFGYPVRDIADYESHMAKALEIIGTNAKYALNRKIPVVFDFGGGMGHWGWLKSVADSTGAFIEIYHFDIPLEIRIDRVRKRNKEKPPGVYHFTMSDEEVLASKPKRRPVECVYVITVCVVVAAMARANEVLWVSAERRA